MQDADEELAFAREASQGRLPKFVELLKFRNLSVGCKVWGCIMSVTSKELIVSLPDGLRGTVAVEEVAPAAFPTWGLLQHPCPGCVCKRWLRHSSHISPVRWHRRVHWQIGNQTSRQRAYWAASLLLKTDPVAAYPSLYFQD